MIDQIRTDERNNGASRFPEPRRIVNRLPDTPRFLGEFSEDISLIQSPEYSGVMIYNET